MIKFALSIIVAVGGLGLFLWFFNFFAVKGITSTGQGIVNKIKGFFEGIQNKAKEAESNTKLNEITSKETEVIARIKDVETKSEETKQKIHEVVEKANKEVDEILKTDKSVGDIHDEIAKEFESLR